jgi:hypothetical protein
MQHTSGCRSLFRAAFACALACSLAACDATFAPEDPENDFEARPRIRVPDPIEPADEGQTADLLQQYAKRDRIERKESVTWELPFKSKRLAVALLITAAKDRPEDLSLFLTPDATWGLPDTRQFGRRRVFDGDGGDRFLRAFRKAARRLPGKASWITEPQVPGVQEMVYSGAEPMWAYWESKPEHIYIRMIVRDRRAQIDYIGFFEDPPPDRIHVRPELHARPGLIPSYRQPGGATQERAPARMPARQPSERVEIREAPE